MLPCTPHWFTGTAGCCWWRGLSRRLREGRRGRGGGGGGGCNEHHRRVGFVRRIITPSRKVFTGEKRGEIRSELGVVFCFCVDYNLPRSLAFGWETLQKRGSRGTSMCYVTSSSAVWPKAPLFTTALRFVCFRGRWDQVTERLRSFPWLCGGGRTILDAPQSRLDPAERRCRGRRWRTASPRRSTPWLGLMCAERCAKPPRTNRLHPRKSTWNVSPSSKPSIHPPSRVSFRSRPIHVYRLYTDMLFQP